MIWSFKKNPGEFQHLSLVRLAILACGWRRNHGDLSSSLWLEQIRQWARGPGWQGRKRRLFRCAGPLRPSASSGHSFKLNPASAVQGPGGDNSVPELISDPLLTSSALRKNETAARKFCSFPVPNSEPAKVRSWWIWASIPGPSSCELPSSLLRSWQTIFVWRVS